jgi:dTDP-4-dehydrorhamnose 3,5-epimerase
MLVATMQTPDQRTQSPPRLELDVPEAPVADAATVTPAGERLAPVIDGVITRTVVVQSDERGSVSEIFNPAWGFTSEPIVYVYETTIHPGQKKAWIVHEEQDDRLFFNQGAAKVVLYDARVGSPTKGMVTELFVGIANQTLVRIPAGVFHGVVNVGADALRFVNLPTRPYRHDKPDKLRLPADSEAIPYRI